ncbi:MAG TPA: hypothetical protein VF483_04300 [Gemmatimonadaceae bacterium]
MHPFHLRELVHRNDLVNRVFVAMPFDPSMERRFAEVVSPTIASFQRNGSTLEAHRVDRSRVSDSIMAEIVAGIANDVLVIADITSHAETGLRNGNVMYELGLAHAMRRPEEVVVVRSDDNQLLFDVSGIRVHKYDPDNDTEGARFRLREIVDAALRFGALGDNWLLEDSIAALDTVSIGVLFRVMGWSLGPDFEDLKKLARDMRFQASIHRLLDLRLLRTRLDVAMSPSSGKPASLDELSSLETTLLGDRVVMELLERTGVWATFASVNPEIAKQREAWLAEHRKPTEQ